MQYRPTVDANALPYQSKMCVDRPARVATVGVRCWAIKMESSNSEEEMAVLEVSDYRVVYEIDQIDRWLRLASGELWLDSPRHVFPRAAASVFPGHCFGGGE